MLRPLLNSLSALTLVYGADIIKDNFQAITFEGTHDSNYSTDWLFGDTNWPNDCYDDMRDGTNNHDGLGIIPVSRILNQGETYLGYYIELSSKQTVGSFYIAAPSVERYRDGYRLEGFVSVVDQISDAYDEAFKCSDIFDNGYYSCSEPLHGKYVAYITKMDEVSSYHDDGVFVLSLVAYGSTNLVTTTQVILEPT